MSSGDAVAELGFRPGAQGVLRPLFYVCIVLFRPPAVKNLPAVQETRVLSLGWEDPLEKGMTIHSSTLAWRIPWTEEPGGLQSTGSQRVRHD